MKIRSIIVGLLLMVSLVCGQNAGPGGVADDALYFVQMTDTHLSQNDNFARMEKAIGYVNNLRTPLACVVITGDLFHDTTYDQATTGEKARTLLATIKAPLHIVAGNHDNINKDNFAEFHKTAPRENYTEIYNEKFLFVFVNSELIKDDQNDQQAQDTWSWLEKTLSATENADKIKFVFHHCPTTGGWKQQAAARWEKVLNDNKVAGEFNGHTHQDSLSYNGDVPVYTSPATCGSQVDMPGFVRVFKYSDGKLTYSTKKI